VAFTCQPVPCTTMCGSFGEREAEVTGAFAAQPVLKYYDVRFPKAAGEQK